MTEPATQVRFEIFRAGSFTSWEQVFREAAEFATRQGPEQVISNSHSEDANIAVVTVWYWA